MSLDIPVETASPWIDRTIDHAVYPRQAIADARQAYREHCDFKVAPLAQGRAQLRIRVKAEHLDAQQEIVLSFLNYALDRAVQLQAEAD